MGIAADWACALDPVQMARLAGIEPDDWQADVLRSTAPRILLNCSRQSGKSSVAAALAAHTALYQPGSLVLCLSRGQFQSGELFQRVLGIYRRLDKPVPASAESRLHLELENGSRVLALPGAEETIRGLSSVRLLCIDEASRVPDSTLDAVLPMLAVSGGRLVALSTPWGRRGWWYEAIQDRTQSGALYVEVPASQCERLAPEFLAEVKRTRGPLIYSQEFECVFVDPQGSVFRTEEVQRAEKEYSTWPLG